MKSSGLSRSILSIKYNQVISRIKPTVKPNHNETILKKGKQKTENVTKREREGERMNMRVRTWIGFQYKGGGGRRKGEKGEKERKRNLPH